MKAYIFGFIGAMVGAIFGSVLWCIATYFGYIIIAMCFFIPGLIVLGYYLTKGAKNKLYIKIITATLSIISICLGSFLKIYYVLASAGVPVSIETIGFVIKNLENISEGLVYNLIIAIGCVYMSTNCVDIIYDDNRILPFNK